MTRTSRSREYGEAVQEAAESLASHWRCLDAGDGGASEYKSAERKAEAIAREHREPFREVWDDVKATAVELYAAGF